MWGFLKFTYKASNWTVPSQTKAGTAKLSSADKRKKRPLCSISSSDPRVLSFYIRLKWQATSPSCVPNGIKQSYDTTFSLTVINYDKKMNNCNTGTKFSIVESNIWGWRQQKQKLINTNTTQKSFSVAWKWEFPSNRTVNCWVCVPTQKTAGVIKCQAIKHKAWEPAKSQIMWLQFKASLG